MENKEIENYNIELKDSTKLYNLGFIDGYEKAARILETSRIIPYDLNPRGPEIYIKGFNEGVKEAEKKAARIQFDEHNTRKI